MKLLHLSDLHLGKRLGEFSLLEDQKHILHEIIGITAKESPDAVLLAGDIYDKSVPPAEAVALFDGFLARLAELDTPVLLISGNHDSPERVAFGSRIMRRGGVYLAPVYDGHVEPVTLTDAFGEMDIFLLPFLKPAHVRRFFPEEAGESYTDALACAVAHMPIRPDRRNVLVTHQFVTGAARCDSEEVSVGGSDNVDAAVFAPFDYVALGHLHGPQNVGSPCIRYCGTPLKYSFSEVRQEKSVTVVELEKKGDTTVRTVPLHPLHDLAEVRGSYQELMAKSYYDALDRSAFFHITLTDEEDIPEALGRLRTVYPNLVRLDYDNRRTRASAVLMVPEEPTKMDPMEQFANFFELQNGQPMTQEQRTLVMTMLETIREGEA